MKRIQLFLLGFILLLGGPLLAKKAPKTHKKHKLQVIQQKGFVRWHRAEITTSFGVDLNEVLTRHYNLAFTGRYHITPNWTVRLDFFKYFGKSSSTAYDIGNYFEVWPERRIMDWYIGAGAEYALFIGKYLAFESRPVWWDFHLFASLGVTRNTSDMYHFTPGLGAGLRVGILQWLAFNMELGDFIFRENYSKEDHFVNNVQFLVGLSVMIPFKYHYKYEK